MEQAQQAGSAERGTVRQRTSGGHQTEIPRPRRRSASCLEGLRGEDSIAELCRKEGIAQNLYYRSSKEFPRSRQEAARRRTRPVRHLPTRSSSSHRSRQLKEALAEVTLESRLLKKKRDRGSERISMRYPASEAEDHPHRRNLASSRSTHARQDRHSQVTFYAWLDRLYGGRPRPRLEDRKPRPSAWNRIPTRSATRSSSDTGPAELSPREVASLHRRLKDLRLQGQRLSHLEAEGPVYDLARLHRHEGSGQVPPTRRRRSTSFGRPTSPT